MIAQESLLVTLVKVVDRIPIPPRLGNEAGAAPKSIQTGCS